MVRVSVRGSIGMSTVEGNTYGCPPNATHVLTSPPVARDADYPHDDRRQGHGSAGASRPGQKFPQFSPGALESAGMIRSVPLSRST